MMKSILIGFGGLLGISALVWVSGQSQLPKELAPVDMKQRSTIKEHMSPLQVDATAFAQSPGATLSQVHTAGDVETISGRDEGADLPRSSSCASSDPNSCNRPQAFSETKAVLHEADGEPVNIFVKRTWRTTESQGIEPITKTSFKEEISEVVIPAREPVRPNDEVLTEPQTLQSDMRAQEIFAPEPIPSPVMAMPIVKEPLITPVIDRVAMSTNAESSNTTPRILAKNELADENAVSEERASMAGARDDREGLRWDEIGIRGGFNAEYVAIPPTEKENFEHFDIFGAMRFPKQYYYESGWEIYFRMNGSLGALRGDGDLGFIGTISPGIVFWYPDWKMSINGGPGLAYVSREKYGRQDLGGPIQIVGQGGLTYYVTDHVGIGWRFHHISDAGMWGSDNRGVDVNLFELTYKF
ncbi:MAG: hypothetical protein NPIRA02_22960 [Nitrospirales bacterium]|nr:MAG: hypothetical protein NPIRA02_22960 [Nitrospirales bacterium]